MFDITKLENKIATSIGEVSCVGIISKKFPLNHGNYFSIYIGKKQYEVANFWFENLEHLIKTNVVSFPINVKILNNRWVLIHDSRIPHNYYSESISYRAPLEFWSIPDLLKRQREIEDGTLEIFDGYEKRTIKTDKRALKIDYTIEPTVNFASTDVIAYNKNIKFSSNKPLKIYTKQFHKSFKTEARTLPAKIGYFQKSGWTITAKIQKDYYSWINDFEATHPDYGFVKGNFESKIQATSKKAYDHFIKHHPYIEWDYWEI